MAPPSKSPTAAKAGKAKPKSRAAASLSTVTGVKRKSSSPSTKGKKAAPAPAAPVTPVSPSPATPTPSTFSSSSSSAPKQRKGANKATKGKSRLSKVQQPVVVDDGGDDDGGEDGDEGVDAAPLSAADLKLHDPIVRQTQQKIKALKRTAPATRAAGASTSSTHSSLRSSTTSSASAPSPSPSPSSSVASSVPSSSKPRTSKRAAKRARTEMTNKDVAATTDEGEGSEGDNERRDEGQEVEEQVEEEEDKEAKSRAPSAKSNVTRGTGRKRSAAAAGVSEESAEEEVSPEELAERGVIYLGHLPHGFFEDQMRAFFTQFGEVTRLRLARNKKSGSSKHHGWVEFAHSDVATIVADAMHRYLMFGHTLIAVVVPREEVHPQLFKGSERPFRVIPHSDNHRRQHNRARSADEQQRRVTRLMNKERHKRKQLEALDIAFDFKGYAGDLGL